MQKFLIIWDFDGVIADTEKLWLRNRMTLLNRDYDLNWDFATTNRHLGGMSDKTKREVLEKMGIATEDKFWDESMKLDMQKIDDGFALTDGIEEIFADKDFAQCIATGGVLSKSLLKIKAVGIEKYFDRKNLFTADMVENGKPAPDLFLLAAKTMGFEPQNCIVIEDSIAGLTAALKAKMNPIAFLGFDMYLGKECKMLAQALGVEHIFYNMRDIKEFLNKTYKQA